jgi:uncharacterized protein (TIGR02145 family)
MIRLAAAFRSSGPIMRRTAAISSCFFILSGLAFAALAQTDIARGKTATASSQQMDANNGNIVYVAAFAVDGNTTTRWGSTFADNQWLKVDLGAVYTITSVNIKWEAASAQTYRIECSTDNVNWSQLSRQVEMPAGARTDNLQGFTGTGRYIRMWGETRTTAYGFSIYDFNVYGNLQISVSWVGTLTTAQAAALTLKEGLAYHNSDDNKSYVYHNNAWEILAEVSVGPQGPKGDKGDTGPQGIQGIQGMPGTFAPGTAVGDMLYWNGSAWVTIPGGSKGQTLTFTDKPEWKGSTTVIDIDGNVYHTVTIGNQTWMVENLRATHLNDGTAIPNASDTAAWFALLSPGYCWYNNDTANGNTYGALYNWYAVHTGKLAPPGWHVPSDAEWTQLSTFLGGEAGAGGKMKEAGLAHWLTPNTGATNESGFMALPGGFRYPTGQFAQVGQNASWWCVQEEDSWGAYYRGIDNNGTSIYRFGYTNKIVGYSVRLVKD